MFVGFYDAVDGYAGLFNDACNLVAHFPDEGMLPFDWAEFEKHKIDRAPGEPIGIDGVVWVIVESQPKLTYYAENDVTRAMVADYIARYEAVRAN